jgi:hypothetical protein
MKKKKFIQMLPYYAAETQSTVLHATWYRNIRKRRNALLAACCVAYAGFESMFAVG